MKSISNIERQLIGVWNNGRTHTDSFRFWFRAPFDQAYLATNAIFSTNKHKHLFVLYYKYIRKRNGLDCEERKKPVESTTLYPITICINASFNIEWLLSTHIQRAATMPRESVNIVSLVWFFNFQYGDGFNHCGREQTSMLVYFLLRFFLVWFWSRRRQFTHNVWCCWYFEARAKNSFAHIFRLTEIVRGILSETWSHCFFCRFFAGFYLFCRFLVGFLLFS